MKKLIIISGILFSVFTWNMVVAQMPAAITLDPVNPTAEETFTITFDPAQACFESGSLAGEASIAMHSGVEFSDGSQWNNIVEYNSTGANGVAPIFTPNGDGTYSFTYNPTDFYDIQSGTIVTKICAVFNNGSNWNTDGRDFDSNGSTCIDFFIPLSYTSTDPSILFRVNMNKQIADGNFDPNIGIIYAVIDGMNDILLQNTYDNNSNPLNIYEGEITSGLNIGQVIDFHYKMNLEEESISRSITLTAGLNNAEAWFNDLSLTILTLYCDMNHQINSGWFDPLNDSLDVAGTFNNWDGLNHHLEDSDNDGIYSVTITPLNPGIVEYKFRINGDWNTSEFPGGGANRVLMLPESEYVSNHVYDDYIPGSLPLTFICHMEYQVSAGHFDPLIDFLDIASSMYNWEGGYQLSDADQDYSYMLTLPVDLSPGAAIEFRFRINGNWETAEFNETGINRMYSILDTIGGISNVIDVWFNDEDPGIGAPPKATNVAILPSYLEVGTELNASYTYEDVNSDPEGATSLKWALADDDQGSGMTVISDGLTSTYTIQESDVDKYIFLSVRPVAQSESGSNASGTLLGDTVTVFLGPVWPLAINQPAELRQHVFPNPFKEFFIIKDLNEGSVISVYDFSGKLILSDEGQSQSQTIHLSDYPQGIYFLTIRTSEGKIISEKLVKSN